MRIHSKFSDYYDSVMAHGTDEHLHWVRDLQEVELKKPSNISYIKEHLKSEKYPFFETDVYKDAPRPINNWRNKTNWKILFLGVCGKFYPVFEYKHVSNGWGEVNYEYAYTLDQIIHIMTKYKDPYLKTFMTKPRRRKTTWIYNTDRDSFRYSTVKTYLATHSAFEGFDKYFVEHNIPVFAIDPEEEKLYLNTELKKYEFGKVMDAYTIYQEIEMYMSGILGLIEPDITNIDDKYLAEAKGFDEWSFKTLPTKHKKRK